MGGKKMFFGGVKIYKPNIFIGGAGATYIKNIADFRSKVFYNVIPIDYVKNFEIDGSNNIKVWIKEGYIANGLYSNEITYFIVLGNVITSLANFLQSGNKITHAYLRGVTTLNSAGYLLMNLTKLERINVEDMSVLSGRTGFDGLTKLKKLYFKSATSNAQASNRLGFNNIPLLKRLYIANVTAFSVPSFDGSMLKITFSLNSIGCKIYYNPAFGIQNRKAFNSINIGFAKVGDKFYINGLPYNIVTTPLVVGDIEFSLVANVLCQNAMNVINNDVRIGVDFTAFQHIGVLGVIAKSAGISGEFTTTSDPLNTSSAIWSRSKMYGGYDVHPVLILLRDDYSSILIECSTPISVNAPTSLTYSNLTSSSVKLNFTVPIANANGTDCFEAWVDDGTVYRHLFEYAEISASGATLDLTEITTDPNSSGIGGLKIKIRTMDGQMNYSDFSNEITLP